MLPHSTHTAENVYCQKMLSTKRQCYTFGKEADSSALEAKSAFLITPNVSDTMFLFWIAWDT